MATFPKYNKVKYAGAPHNSYLLQYAETGLIGIVFFIAFWVLFLWKYRRKNRFLLLALLSYLGVFYNTETVSLAYVENQIMLGVLVLFIVNSKENEKSLI